MKILLALILITIGCTTKNRNKGYNENKPVATISLDETSDFTEKKLIIEKDSSIGYGPESDEIDQSANTNVNRIPIVSMNLMPSLYGSYAYIVLLKNLEKKNIKPKILASTGFTSLFAALYAKNASTSYLEWKVYELTSRIKKYTPYSNDWLSTINSFIDKEFKEQKLSQLKSLLVVPIIEEGRIKLITSGLVKSVLKDAMKFSHSHHFVSSPGLFNSELRHLGADIVVNLSAFPSKLTTSSLGDYHWGVYTGYAGAIMRLDEDILRLESDKFTFIDVLKPASTVNNLFRTQADELAVKIEEMYKAWQEEISSSSN